jgi:uncharacterized protein YndB with AHSA1/START domain
MTEPICELRSDGERATLHFERLYDFTPEELWAALTDPDRIQRWLARASTFELQLGGGVQLDFGDTEDARVAGAIRALEPGRVLEYDWTFPGEEESFVRFEIVPQAQGTLLVLDHRRLGRDFAAGYGAGWQAYLEALAGERELGDWDRRFEELHPRYVELASALP